MLIVLEGVDMTDPVADLFCYGTPDREVGDQEYGHVWYGRYQGPFTREDLLRMVDGDERALEEFTEEDEENLASCVGVIARADHDGFRFYGGYHDRAAFEQDWRQCLLRVARQDQESFEQALSEGE